MHKLGDQRTKLLFCLALGALVLINWIAFRRASQPPLTPGKFTPHEFRLKRKGSAPTAIRSLVYLPKGYDQSSPATRWPLVLFLHGSWHRGDDLDSVRTTGLPQLISHGRHYPFILVAPQCPAEDVWSTDDLERLISAAEEKFRVDREQIHVTGFELGGYAAWDLAAAYPDRFATVVPFGGMPTDSKKRTNTQWMNRVHIWSFVSSNDRSTNLSGTRAPVFRASNAGDYVRLTDVFGDERPLTTAWTQAYENADVVSWMLRKRRKSSFDIRWQEPPSPGEQVRGELIHTGVDDKQPPRIAFSLYLPPAPNNSNPASAPPMILWLQRKKAPVPSSAAPLAVVVAPDLLADNRIDAADVEQLLERLDVELAFNPHRCFLVGAGEAARLAWELAADDPWRFAGMVLAGYRPGPTHNQQANSMAQIPKWFIAGDAAAKQAFDYCLLVSKTSNLTGPRPAPKLQEGEAEVSLNSIAADGALIDWFLEQRTTQWNTRRNTWPTNVRSLDMMASPEVAALFKEHEFTPAGERPDRGDFRYRLFVPSSPAPKDGYPLIVWLHGHGTGEFQLEAGEIKYMDLVMRPPVRADRYDFCVLALQCPQGQSWETGRDASNSNEASDEPITILMQILEELREKYSIDADRISLVGISSGGNACWELARRHPDYFSAIAPLGSHGVDLSRTDSMRGACVWAFKGLTDEGADELRRTV